MANGLHRILWQLSQQAEIIQNLLSVWLKNFSAYAVGRARGLFKDKGPNSFIREEEAQDRTAASGPDHHDVNRNIHERQVKENDAKVSGFSQDGMACSGSNIF